MRPKTSGNTCARPISPTACSKTTPQSSTLVSSHGVAFSTNSAASHPLPAAIGPPWVNQFEVWYNYLEGHFFCTLLGSDGGFATRLYFFQSNGARLAHLQF